MAKVHARLGLLTVLLCPALCLAADDASFTRLVQQIGSAVDSDRAMQTRPYAEIREFFVHSACKALNQSCL